MGKIAFRVYLATSLIDWRIARWLRVMSLETIFKRKRLGLIVDSSVVFTGIERMKIGRNVSIHKWCYISANGGLEIGNDVSIGHRTSILTTEHSYSDHNVPIKEQAIVLKSVKIGNNVWIGANVIVLAGVEIGDRTVVAAGAVVKHSFPSGNVVIGGVPARALRSLT